MSGPSLTDIVRAGALVTAFGTEDVDAMVDIVTNLTMSELVSMTVSCAAIAWLTIETSAQSMNVDPMTLWQRMATAHANAREELNKGDNE